VTKQLGSDGLGVWEVLGSDLTNQSLFVLSVVLPHFARSRAPPLGYRARQRIAAVHGVVVHRSAKTDTCLGRQRVRTLGGRQKRQNECDAARKEGGQLHQWNWKESEEVGDWRWGLEVTSQKITSRHFPRAPIRRRDRSPRLVIYGRGSDLEVILEVIGSADRRRV